MTQTTQNPNSILVTGGAGYIGSHCVKALLQNDYSVTVIDNLDRGHLAAVDPRATFIEADLHDTDLITKTLLTQQISCVVHFAALAYVGESVTDPLRYYTNNTAGSLSLLNAINEANIQKLVFSSTCATYGEPATMPITESTPQVPINPYGWSKLMTERALIDYAAVNPDFAFTVLRYFNVAGSAADGSVGEDHHPETHIIPLIIQAALGRRDSITIFGEDYPTPDGTCIRDYIHVEDLCAAHILAMKNMNPGQTKFYNLGIGKGYSVKEVVDAVRRVAGKDFTVNIGPRRDGDPPELYANADLVAQELGFKPNHTDLDEIVRTAYNWLEANPDGYPKNPA